MTTVTTSDCRSDEGITIGLIDGIIAMSRVFVRTNDTSLKESLAEGIMGSWRAVKQRDLSGEGVKEALLDLLGDEDFTSFLKVKMGSPTRSQAEQSIGLPLLIVFMIVVIYLIWPVSTVP